MSSVIELVNISKTYDGIKVLKNIDFTLNAGEVHALVGENGAGKTTLIKILAGNVMPDPGGLVKINEEEFEHLTVARARAFGITVIYQDICLFPNLSVAENITFGIKMQGIYKKDESCAIARNILLTMGVEIEPEIRLEKLSVGQQQLVAIARALAFNSRIVVMDEPTASLSASETELLYTMISTLKERGIAIIYISHKFDEIFKVADRVTVLRDGERIATDLIQNFNQDMLIRMMAGRELRFVPLKNQTPSNDILFGVEKLTCEPYFRDISFELKKYEILGITGLVGSGRSELAQCIFGILKADSGTMYFGDDKETINVANAKQAIELGICYLPEDRREQGLLMSKSMKLNVSAANIKQVLNRYRFISGQKESAVARQFIEDLSIKPKNEETAVMRFSGGNQQKILVARWLFANPRLLIVDEVTSGVDVGSKLEIHQLIRDLASQGVGVIMISSDIGEVMALADSVMVMRQGNNVGVFSDSSLNQEMILEKGLLG